MAKIRRAPQGERYDNTRPAARGYSTQSRPAQGRSGGYSQQPRTRSASGQAQRQRKVSFRQMQQRRRRRRRSALLLLLQAGASALLLFQIWRTGMLPEKLLLALGAVLLALFVLTAAAQRHRVRGALMRLLSLALSVVLLAGSLYTQQGLTALYRITGGLSGQTKTGVYVLAGDPAASLQDTAGYTYGRLGGLNRTDADSAAAAIRETAAAVDTAQEYQTAFELAGALYGGQVQAILMNESFVSMLEEEGSAYTDFSQRTRCVYEYAADSQNGLQGGVTGAQAKQIVQQPFIVYLSGVDTRGDLNDRCRSDVNILAVVNPQEHHILLVNTPRDYYVELAGADGAKDKLTHAGLYGVDRSMATLAALYGVDVPYYVKINFAGFIQIVDALGGITVTSDQAFTSVGSPGYYDPTSFVKGENTLDGKAALAFARERHAFADGDIQRGANQMKVISAIIDKAKSPAVLKHYSRLLDGVADSFLTNLSQDQIAALVKEQLRDGADWTVESFAVTGTSASSTQCYSARGSKLYVMQPDEASVAQAKTRIAAVMAGTPAASESASPAA